MDKICKPSLSFQDCELAILRVQVDKAQSKISMRIVESAETIKIFKEEKIGLLRRNCD
jgi:hypothetical protein